MSGGDPASGLVEGIRAGDRRALARAITMTESRRPDHRREADDVLDRLMSATGKAIRVGISGAPGAGKSTLIDAVGLHLLEEEHRRVAVLAVDPSSVPSGGSILGDKTRMADLARHEDAFIRPSPSGGTIGGVARRTREAMLLCEAFGFDTVFVETVGVGQSEVAVDDMVDCFVLVVAPGGGDELQGMKRGIVELADIVVVAKTDGDLALAARQATADYRHAVQFLRPKSAVWAPPVLPVSARDGIGITELWRAVAEHNATLRGTGEFARRRSRQATAWMWQEVREGLVRDLTRHPDVAARLRVLEDDVAAGRRSPPGAAGAALADYQRSNAADSI